MQFSSVSTCTWGSHGLFVFMVLIKHSDFPWLRKYNPSLKLSQYSVFVNFLLIICSLCLFFYSVGLKWSISRDLSLEYHTGRTMPNARAYFYLRMFPLHTLNTAYSNPMHFFFCVLGPESPTLKHSYFLYSQKWLYVQTILWNLKVCEYVCVCAKLCVPICLV